MLHVDNESVDNISDEQLLVKRHQLNSDDIACTSNYGNQGEIEHMYPYHSHFGSSFVKVVNSARKEYDYDYEWKRLQQNY